MGILLAALDFHFLGLLPLEAITLSNLSAFFNGKFHEGGAIQRYKEDMRRK
jgi:hypothetical protein